MWPKSSFLPFWKLQRSRRSRVWLKAHRALMNSLHSMAFTDFFSAKSCFLKTWWIFKTQGITSKGVWLNIAQQIPPFSTFQSILCVGNCSAFNFLFSNQSYDTFRAVMLKYRQMIIVSYWMIVSLLLAACSVECHWRRLNPARGFDDLVFVKRSQSSAELSNAGRCFPPNICLPTLSCPDVLSLLKKAVREPYLREQTIALVRRNVPCSIFTIAHVPRWEKGCVGKNQRGGGLLPCYSCSGPSE